MKNILIIDDNEDMREMLTELLTTAKFEVVGVSDALTASRKFKEADFDLAIVDILLPDRNGIELIKEFLKQRPGLKVIVISGGGKLGPKGYLNMANRIGVEHTFAKPFEVSKLLNTVQDLLK